MLNKVKIENYKTKSIVLLLSTTFFVFYLSQIPFWSNNSDVLVYCSRGASDFQISKNAYLDERSLFLTSKEPLPNYHIGHNLLLWVAYHILPNYLSKTQWPAGLVSAISGALIVSLTFLIWLKIGLDKKEAICIAIVAGLIPTIWYHNIIGEVNSLQLLFILFFLYLFLQNHLILSALAFLAANLVTPLSGIGYSLILLNAGKNKILVRAIIVGVSALFIYSIIYFFLDINVLKGFNILIHDENSRTLMWKIYKLSTYFIININFLIILLICGSKIALKKYNKLFFLLLLSMIPYFILSFKCISELGSQQIIICWALSFPVGLCISSEYISCRYVMLAFLGLALTFYFIWYIPNNNFAKAQHKAGEWLKFNIQDEFKVIGDWKSTVGVVLARYDWNLEKLSSKYIEKDKPTEEDLIKMKQNTIIIASGKQKTIRAFLSKLNISGIKQKNYKPEEIIKTGTVRLIFENDAVIIYRWDKIPKDQMLEIQ